MLRLLTNPLGPFWLEDLAYSTIDEMRRLPARAREAWTWTTERAAEYANLVTTTLVQKLERTRPSVASAALLTPARLDEPEEWALATSPVTAAEAGAVKALALHKTAAEQLDALTYVLDRLREEVRPLMNTARFADEPVVALPESDEREAALEALLELSRQNAMTRPKRYAQSAA